MLVVRNYIRLSVYTNLACREIQVSFQILVHLSQCEMLRGGAFLLLQVGNFKLASKLSKIELHQL